MKVHIPPIKCQGIKTKLVPLISEMILWDRDGTWIEPFTGSGVVGFNLAPRKAIFADTNPHTIAFYNALKSSQITPGTIRDHLVIEGALLLIKGDEHYYAIRERFNSNGNPLDFLFLSRACFNGVMRFNRKGGFNVPFCRKPNRFAQAYITKIVNQSESLFNKMQTTNWKFVVQPFDVTIGNASTKDFIYADPPYVGRHVDYFDSWDNDRERQLFSMLDATEAKFIFSTWEENTYRRNSFLDELWSKFPRVNEAHFYHVGASEDNRNAMTEALVMNYTPPSQEAYRTSVSERKQLVMAF